MLEDNINHFSLSQAAVEHLNSLHGFAIKLTHNNFEAEDLVQETYLRATRISGRLLPDNNVKALLFIIMRNTWISQRRHTSSGPVFVELDGETIASHSFDRTPIDQHVHYVKGLESRQVRDAIQQLPAGYREIVLLRDFEDFSYQEIADLLGCPRGTVMSRLSRAHERLRLLLKRWRE